MKEVTNPLKHYDVMTAGGTFLIYGNIYAMKTGSAIAVPGNLTISDAGNGIPSFLVLGGDEQLAATSVVTFNPTGPGRTIKGIGKRSDCPRFQYRPCPVWLRFVTSRFDHKKLFS